MKLQIKGMRFKVSKKHEKLARALLYVNLFNIGFPSEKILERVDEAWMSYLDHAKSIQLFLDHCKDSDLTGFTSLDEINHWKQGEE